MSILKDLAEGDCDAWFGTWFFSIIFGLLFLAFIAIFSNHETSCYYPLTLDGSNTNPYTIKGDVNWSEDHTAYRFATNEERNITLDTLVQCTTK